METDDIPTKQPASGMPERRLAQLASLGKLIEEVGELTGVLGRCVCQGIDEVNPSSGKTNRRRLEDEVADVKALVEIVTEIFSLNEEAMERRIDAKYGFKSPWIHRLRKLDDETK